MSSIPASELPSYGRYYSPQPLSCISPQSIPFCVFRNRERYWMGKENIKISSDMNLNYLRTKAWDQTKYYKEHLAEHHIPSYLLNDYILEELNDNQQQNSNSIHNKGNFSKDKQTLIGCHHDHQSLTIHAAGKNMDELVMRNTNQIQPNNNKCREPGFSLPIGNGSSIEQILRCGTSMWSSCSHIIVRTSDSNIYHLRTVNIDDHTPRSDFKKSAWPTTNSKQLHDKSPSNLAQGVFILEPLQRYQLPNEIVHMSASKSAWIGSVLLSLNGQIYSWTPLEGMHAYSKKCVFPNSVMDNEDMNNNRIASTSSIESSLHPMIHYVTLGKRVYSADLRSNSFASELFTSSNNIVESLCQHGNSPEHLMASYGKNCVLVDTRYTKSFLAHRPIPETHTNLKFLSGEYLNNNCNYGGGGYYQGGGENIGGDLFIGSSGKGRQIFAHSIDINSMSSHQNRSLNTIEDIDTNDNYSKWAMLSAGSSFGASSSVCWDTIGVPIIDRSSDATLVGFDLISCPSGRFTKFDDDESSSNNNDDDDNNNNKEENNDNDNENFKRIKSDINQISPYDAILFHQSSLGDVYAQRMVYPNYKITKEMNAINSNNINLKIKVIKKNNGSIKRLDSKSRPRKGTTSTSSSSSSSSSNSSSSGSDNNDSENESSSSDNEKTTSGFGKSSKPIKKKPTSIINTTTNNNIKKNINIKPPIQMELPCGVRGDAALFDYSEFVRFNRGGLIGTGLEGTISNQDVKNNLYPLSSNAFTSFVDESSLKGFDILTLVTDDMNNEIKFHKKNKKNKDNKKELNIISNIEELKSILDNSDILNNLINKIDIFAMTLWEIWRYLYDVTNQMYHIIPDILRSYLNNISELEESFMQILPISIHSLALLSDYNNSFSLTDGYKIGQDNNSSIYNKYKYEYLDQICCTCIIMKDATLNDVTICDKKGCIIPHHIIYKTSKTCSGEPNNHNTVNSVVNKSKNKALTSKITYDEESEEDDSNDSNDSDDDNKNKIKKPNNSNSNSDSNKLNRKKILIENKKSKGYMYESEKSSDITNDLISRLRSEWMRYNI